MLKNGYTLMHEHITIDLSKEKQDLDCYLDCQQETISELKALYKQGVRNIVDMTNMGMGRMPEYLEQVEQESGINIIQATGFYKEPFLPDLVKEKTTKQLADIMVRELTEHLEGSSKRAAIIGELGTSKNQMRDLEKKVFDAGIEAAKRTGKPIYTHTTLGTYALEQIEYFKKHHMDLKSIVIGHMDLNTDLAYIKEVLYSGVYIGFDTIGKNNYLPDSRRAYYIAELEREGLLNQVVLSLDITRKSHLKYKGGIGYTYLIDTFLPMLRQAGVKEDSIEKMLIENPRAIFA